MLRRIFLLVVSDPDRDGDPDRTLGPKETGGRTALPIFPEIVLRVYEGLRF